MEGAAAGSKVVGSVVGCHLEEEASSAAEATADLLAMGSRLGSTGGVAVVVSALADLAELPPAANEPAG